jgi:hypothetical protein
MVLDPAVGGFLFAYEPRRRSRRVLGNANHHELSFAFAFFVRPVVSSSVKQPANGGKTGFQPAKLLDRT